MSPSQIARALKGLMETKRPVYIWGPPGTGKSQILHQVAGEMGMEVADIRAATLDPVDLRGLPKITKNIAEWCPPAFLPRKGKGILFLDELAQAPPLVQSACLQLVLDRKVGEYELPKDWVVVAASNRQEDRAGAHRLISPLLNRFIHLDLEVSIDEWMEWATAKGIAVEIRTFLKFKGTLLHNFDPNSGERSFPTPRSWEFMSDALRHTPEDLIFPVAQGCVGKGAAAELTNYLKNFRELPDREALLKDPKNYPVPKEPAVLWAITGTLMDLAAKAEQGRLGAIVCYLTRLPVEFAGWAMRELVAVRSEVSHFPEAREWLRKHRVMIAGSV